MEGIERLSSEIGTLSSKMDQLSALIEKSLRKSKKKEKKEKKKKKK